MVSDLQQTRQSNHGFTLLETLVALGIASILIATLIPVSRDSLKSIVRIGGQAESLAAIEDGIQASRFEGRVKELGTNTSKTIMTKQALPAFTYPRDEKNPWQPTLVTIETRSASGAITRAEIIRLERSAP